MDTTTKSDDTGLPTNGLKVLDQNSTLEFPTVAGGNHHALIFGTVVGE